MRGYRLYIPDGVASPAPLVVMLHGGFGSANQAENTYGWDELADGAKFVVAYPDDVGFISGVVRDVEANIAIDPARVYATGSSTPAARRIRHRSCTSTARPIG